MIIDIPNINKDPLLYVLDTLKKSKNDLWLEFGVFTGRTINLISSYTLEDVYGFDSFEGLPEFWRDGFDKGEFNLEGVLPEVNNNVKLIKGWFNDTLPLFLKNIKNSNITLLHIDCDLYSSTKYVLDTCLPYIKPGCFIIFDELVNYDGWDGDNGEFRALKEWVEENNKTIEWVGMNGSIGNHGGEHERVAIKIIK
jgi:hypothetical protein